MDILLQKEEKTWGDIKEKSTEKESSEESVGLFVELSHGPGLPGGALPVRNGDRACHAIQVRVDIGKDNECHQGSWRYPMRSMERAKVSWTGPRTWPQLFSLIDITAPKVRTSQK